MPALLLAFISAAALASLGDLRAQLWATIGILLLWGAGVLALPRPVASARWVFAAALGLRLLLLFTEPTLSDEVYRYLWEGRAVLLGGNPYLQAPADAIWDGVAGADAIRGRVALPDQTSAWPPAAMAGFAMISGLWYDPMAWKALMGLLDAATAGVLARILIKRGHSDDSAWIYALHPLGALHAAGSGHLEAAALCCLMTGLLAWDRKERAAGWVGLGAMLAGAPALVLPALLRREALGVVVVLILGGLAALPFSEAGPDLWAGALAQWGQGGMLRGPVDLLEALIGAAAGPLGLLVGLAMVLHALLSRRDPAHVALWAGAAVVLLSPGPVPWAVGWAWLPALTTGVRSWSILATLAPLSYAAWASYDHASSSWTEPLWPSLLIYPPFLCALVWEWWQRLTRPGPWAPSATTIPSRSVSQT
jgi:hypothetical protein